VLNNLYPEYKNINTNIIVNAMVLNKNQVIIMTPGLNTKIDINLFCKEYKPVTTGDIDIEKYRNRLKLIK